MKVGVFCLVIAGIALTATASENPVVSIVDTTAETLGETTEARDRYVDQVAMESQKEAILKLKRLLGEYRGTRREPVLLMKLGELEQQDAAFEFRIAHGQSHRKDASIQLDRYKKSMRESIEYLSQLIDNFSSFEDIDLAFFMRGKAYQEIEKKEQAKKDFNTLVSRFSDRREAETATMALADYAIEENQHEEALKYLKAIEQKPESAHYPFALYKMAWSLYNLQRIPEGLSYLERQVSYLKKLNLGNSSSDQALFENSLSDIAMFYFDAYDRQVSGFEVAKSLDYFRTIETGPAMGKMLIRFAKHLRASGKQANLVQFKDDLISRENLRIETLDVARICFEDQMNKKLLEPLSRTSKDFVALYRVNPKMVETESYQATQKLLIETAEQFQLLAIKNKKANELKMLSATLSELYKSFIEMVDVKDPRIPKAHYNLAETLFAISEFEPATQHYRWVVENWQGKKGFDAKVASLKSISSRYEALKRLKVIPEKLEARAIRTEAAVEKLASLDEWILWMDAHSKKYRDDPIQQFLFEGDRALYAQGQLKRSVERMTEFALVHGKSIEAVGAASLVLDTYVAGSDWKQANDLTTRFLKFKSWVDVAFEQKVKILAADSFYKLAEVAFESKDFSGALESAEECVNKYSQSERFADCRMLAAKSANQLQKQALAERHLLAQVQSQPDHERSLQAHILVSQIFESNFQFDRAAQHIEKAMSFKKLLRPPEIQEMRARALKLYWYAGSFQQLEKLAIQEPVDEKYLALGAIQTGTPFKGVQSKDLRTLWNVSRILHATEASYEERVESLRSLAKGWEKLDAETQLVLLPSLNSWVQKGLGEARQSLARSYKLRSTPKAIKLRVELMLQFENAVTALTQLPWLSVKAIALNEAADMYNDFSAALRTLPAPENLSAAELTEFNETIQKLTFPFEEKAQQIREKAFEVAQKGQIAQPVFDRVAAAYFKESPSIAKQLDIQTDFIPQVQLTAVWLDRLSKEENFVKYTKSKFENVRVDSENRVEWIKKNFLSAVRARNFVLSHLFLSQLKSDPEFNLWSACYLAEAGMQSEAIAALSEHQKNFDTDQRTAWIYLWLGQSIASRDRQKTQERLKEVLGSVSVEQLPAWLKESENAWLVAWAVEWTGFDLPSALRVELLSRAKGSALSAKSLWARTQLSEAAKRSLASQSQEPSLHGEGVKK